MSKSDDQQEIKPVSLTTAGAEKVHALIHEEGKPGLCLRISVKGGGCSGFQYGFMFEEGPGDDDFQFTTPVAGTTVCLLVDPVAYQLLVGAEVDYQSDIEGERFVIRNPNAQSTCGCGSSFAA